MVTKAIPFSSSNHSMRQEFYYSKFADELTTNSEVNFLARSRINGTEF